MELHSERHGGESDLIPNDDALGWQLLQRLQFAFLALPSLAFGGPEHLGVNTRV
jgi:hypothetical protein